MLIDGDETPLTRRGARRKRIFDLAVGVPSLVVALPIIGGLAIGSGIVYRANPIFVQWRVGRNGQQFRCPKVRTLPTTAPTDADRPTINGHHNHGWGDLLRTTHLDELPPQLVSVLTGTMSLVGPRPVVAAHSDLFDQAFAATRQSVKPGLTGLWQVSSAAERPVDEHPEYDDYYVRQRTLRLDLWVCWTTISVVLLRRSAICLNKIPRWTGAQTSEGATH